MFLVTHTKRTTERNEEGELVATVTKEANVEPESAARDILERRAMRDTRVLTARVFNLDIDEEGVPAVGDEQ